MGRVMYKTMACLLAASILPASLGLNAVPRPAPPGSSDEDDYPCKGHACGCITAAICRTDCCCQPKAPSCCGTSSHARPAVAMQGPATGKPARPSAELTLRAPGCWGWDAWSFEKESSWLGPTPVVINVCVGIVAAVSPETLPFRSAYQAPAPPPPRLA